MAERRRYTQKTRAKAVGIATVEGVTEAERQTGIPKQTIDYWLDKPEFGHLRTTAREVVVDSFWVGIQIGAKALTEGLQSDAPLNHKADAFRSLADRYLLLNGEATARSEHRDISDPDDTAVSALEGRLAWPPPQVPVGVVAGGNGTHTNGKH